MLNLKWAEAQHLLEEGDILLFRAKPSMLGVSYWISKYTRSVHSHVSLVTFEDKTPYCLEFREFIGSRLHPLTEELEKGEVIDVYRIMRRFQVAEINRETNRISTKEYEFNPKIAKNITNYARSLVTQKVGYSWALIARMSLYFVPVLRLLQYNSIDELKEEAFVCSTLVSRTYREFFVDLVPGVPDYLTNPGDIAKSGLIYYMFTIKAEEK
jgi:hypothetical protein